MLRWNSYAETYDFDTASTSKTSIGISAVFAAICTNNICQASKDLIVKFIMSAEHKISFIANDHRFFFRHFAPAILAARACRLRILALLPAESDFDSFEQQVQVVSSPIDRQSLTIRRLLRQAAWLVAKLRDERPAIVVAFSVRTSLVVALALPFVRVRRVVIYVTGLGLLDLMPDRKSRLLRAFAYGLLRLISRRRNCYFIFENRHDPLSMGFREGTPERQVLLVGAGIDEAEFKPTAFPPIIPFKLATVSRLVWSKGIDIVAQAVSELVMEGYRVELSVYGAPDDANPRSIDPKSFAHLSNIFYRGHSENIADVWAQHHAAVFASRGGEGVPRSLLEAAACGRPCIVTDVPGCCDFIRNGVEGYVVPVNSVVDLKKAILRLMTRPECLPAFGEAARNRVLQASTTKIVQSQYEKLFDFLASESGKDEAPRRPREHPKILR